MAARKWQQQPECQNRGEDGKHQRPGRSASLLCELPETHHAGLAIHFPEERAGDGDVAGDEDSQDETAAAKPADARALARRLDSCAKEPPKYLPNERAHQVDHGVSPPVHLCARSDLWNIMTRMSIAG